MEKMVPAALSTTQLFASLIAASAPANNQVAMDVSADPAVQPFSDLLGVANVAEAGLPANQSASVRLPAQQDHSQLTEPQHTSDETNEDNADVSAKRWAAHPIVAIGLSNIQIAESEQSRDVPAQSEELPLIEGRESHIESGVGSGIESDVGSGIESEVGSHIESEVGSHIESGGRFSHKLQATDENIQPVNQVFPSQAALDGAEIKEQTSIPSGKIDSTQSVSVDEPNAASEPIKHPTAGWQSPDASLEKVAESPTETTVTPRSTRPPATEPNSSDVPADRVHPNESTESGEPQVVGVNKAYESNPHIEANVAQANVAEAKVAETKVVQANFAETPPVPSRAAWRSESGSVDGSLSKQKDPSVLLPPAEKFDNTIAPEVVADTTDEQPAVDVDRSTRSEPRLMEGAIDREHTRITTRNDVAVTASGFSSSSDFDDRDGQPKRPGQTESLVASDDSTDTLANPKIDFDNSLPTVQRKAFNSAATILSDATQTMDTDVPLVVKELSEAMPEIQATKVDSVVVGDVAAATIHRVDAVNSMPAQSNPLSGAAAIEVAAGIHGRDLTEQAVAAVTNMVESADGSRRLMAFQLEPADLGRLTIQITQSGEAIAAQIIASELTSSELLNSQKETLQTALSELGFADASVDVSHDNQSSHKQDSPHALPKFSLETQSPILDVIRRGPEQTSKLGVDIIA